MVRRNFVKSHEFARNVFTYYFEMIGFASSKLPDLKQAFGEIIFYYAYCVIVQIPYS